MDKYPKTIYVKRETLFTPDEVFIVETDLQRVGEFGTTVLVAVYELKEVRRAVNRTELIEE